MAELTWTVTFDFSRELSTPPTGGGVITPKTF